MVAIRENGDVWLDRQPVDLRELRGIIERLHVERPEDSVVIIADRASRAGMVAKVMDEVRAGGIKDVAIAADTETGG
jgi:biopolymer transport protein ExbD